MRTSRISRDTVRIVAATRTLRQTRTAANIAIHGPPGRANKAIDDTENDENPGSDSELSSVPAESGSDEEAYTTNRKRKRGKDVPVTVKREKEEISITTVASPRINGKPKKARRTPAKKVKDEDGGFTIEPPTNWQEIYTLTRQMRNENVAPVDTMGCESLAEKDRSPRDRRLQTLIALMLSSQTKDTVTAVAMRGMQERMPGVCQ